jgi:hypothetical protein
MRTLPGDCNGNLPRIAYMKRIVYWISVVQDTHGWFVEYWSDQHRMATTTQFFQYWALAFVTLSAALVLLNLFCGFIDSDIHFHSVSKETLVAGVASAVQGAGFWFSASLFQGQPFRRMVIPGVIVAIIYWLTHLPDWSGYEVGGIAYFQMALLAIGFCLLRGEIQLAVMILGLFIAGLVIIAGIARSL